MLNGHRHRGDAGRSRPLALSSAQHGRGVGHHDAWLACPTAGPASTDLPGAFARSPLSASLVQPYGRELSSNGQYHDHTAAPNAITPATR